MRHTGRWGRRVVASLGSAWLGWVVSGNAIGFLVGALLGLVVDSIFAAHDELP